MANATEMLNLLEATTAPKEPVFRTDIQGVYWMENDWVKTGEDACIVLPSEGPMIANMVWGGSADQDAVGYEVYGIHVGQTDRLTFINGKNIGAEFVDCRRDSPTLHKKVSFSFDADPRRHLVVERGIAHRFDNIKGVVIRNEPVFYCDFGRNADFFAEADTINVPKESDSFPVVAVNRRRLPDVLSRTILLLQRLRIRR